MKTKSAQYMLDFQVIRPDYQLSQSQALDWLSNSHIKHEGLTDSKKSQDPKFTVLIQKMLERFGCSPKKLGFRASMLRDFSHENWEDMLIYRLDVPNSIGGMESRTLKFKEFADKIFGKFYENVSEPPSDIVHVTCTGYVSPSSAQSLIAEKNWGESTIVTHAYHMGCYASIPALRQSLGFLANQKNFFKTTRPVNVVHTEMCSLHFDPTDHSPEQLVVQSLFADGFIKYSLTDSEVPVQKSWKVLGYKETLIPESEDAMTWICADWGMKMTLARSVPEIISNHVESFVKVLLRSNEISTNVALKDVYFAVHPGGPKIIDKTQEILNISEDKISESKSVFYKYGNMSSATLPHVWNEMLENKSIPSGAIVVSLAFGPGLTICGAVFEKV